MKVTKITVEELEQLYTNNPNKVVCKKLGITNPTLLKYLRSANIPLKGSGNRNKKHKLVIT